MQTEEYFPIPTKLWNKNFVKFMVAYESLYFGYFTMIFAIPLYILTATGSPAALASAMALAGLPRVAVGLVSGVVADRYNKRKILICGYMLTTFSILLYLLFMGRLPLVPAATAVILVLMGVDAFLMPSLEGSIPRLVPDGSMQRATSAISSISVMSMIAAPMLAGFIFGRRGIAPVLVLAACLYGLAMIFALLYKFPYTKQKHKQDLLHSIVPDMKKAIQYSTKENSTFIKITLLFFLVSIAISPVFTVGFMAIGSSYMGISHAALGTAMSVGQVGGVVGPMITYALGGRVHIQRMRLFFFIPALALAGIGLVLMYTTAQAQLVLFVASFFVIQLSFAAVMPIIWSYFGENSPPDMVGKIMSLAMMFSFLGMSIGEFAWGQLLGRFIEAPWVALFAAAGLSVLVSVFAKIRVK